MARLAERVARSPAARADRTDAQGQGGDAGRRGGEHGGGRSARRSALAAAQQHRAGRARPGARPARAPLRALRGRLQHLRPQRTSGAAGDGERDRVHREALAPEGERGQERRRPTGGAALPRLPAAARAARRRRRGAAVEALEGAHRRADPRADAAKLGKLARRVHRQAQRVPASAGSASSASARPESNGRCTSSTRTSGDGCARSSSRTGRRKRTIARSLIQLGVKPQTAWRNVYEGRKSLWALSHTPAVDRGTPERVLRRTGARVAGGAVDGRRTEHIVAPVAAHAGAGMSRGREPAGGGGHNPSSRRAVCEQH